ncbi:hypothetical protein V2I01_12235 [Micromonospora sp. BRA006-A]|nr:hypothetical protein [Micromonospora sp. BRA006-A]
MRIAVIGFGTAGEGRLHAYRAVTAGRVVAVLDPSPERRARPGSSTPAWPPTPRWPSCSPPSRWTPSTSAPHRTTTSSWNARRSPPVCT